MKSRFLALLAVAAIAPCAHSQLLLNTGDSYTYEFASLPGPFDFQGPMGVAGLMYITLSAESLQAGNVLRLEMFEDSLALPPIVTSTITGADPNSGGIFVSGDANAWRDRQGAIRISVLSGAATVNQVQLFSSELGGRFGVQYYSQTFAPVPEPGTWSLLGLAGLAALGWRARRQ